MPTRNSPTVVDLFCGAGGLSLGFCQAGFRPILAIDSFPAAVDTYRANCGDHVRLDTIDEMTQVPSADIIVGGPPCQGFSSAGLQRIDDTRNTLVRVFASIIARVRPRAFVFENVEGFLTSDKGQRVIELLDPLVDAGYRIHLRKINAANFGVAQHRKRVIAIGGLGWTPCFPEPTHSAFGAPGAHLGGRGLPPAMTLKAALDGLPPAIPCEESNSLDDHSFRPLKDDDLKRAKRLRPNQRMRDLPEEYWHESYKRRAYRRVMDGTPTERRGGAPAGIRRLAADEPSKAITGGARNEFLHPSEDRALTLRECARIQSFPDHFQFVGSASDRTLLIGNAVPPKLAKAIALSLYEDVMSATHEPDASGALLSFVPTLSSGMSPALQRTCELVRSKFLLAASDSQLALWQ